MDFEYKGGNCVVITTKNGRVVVDGKLSDLGLKDVNFADAIDVATQDTLSPANDNVRVDGPGEYEVNDISFVGVPAKRLIDHDGSEKATMYRIATGGLAIGVIGHVAVPLSDEQLEQLGIIDVLIVPIGGNGYTLDGHQAVELVRAIEPKVVIPTHFADSKVHYEVPQLELEQFLKEVSAAHETTAKYRVKNAALPETLTIVELSRTS